MLAQLHNSEVPQFKIGTIGAGVSVVFMHTIELHVTNYDEAIKSSDLKPRNNKSKMIMTGGPTTRCRKWSRKIPCQMKPDSEFNMGNEDKNNGKLRGMFNAKGFVKKEVEHYDPLLTSAPVVTDATIQTS